MKKLFLLTVILFAFFSCSKDDEGGKDNNNSGNSQEQFFVNPADPLILRSTLGDGTIIEYYGEKDDRGIATSVKYVLVKEAVNNEETTIFVENGLIKEILLKDGNSFSFEWDGYTCKVMFVSYDGLTVMYDPDRVKDENDFTSLASIAGEGVTIGTVNVNTCDNNLENIRVRVRLYIDNTEELQIVPGTRSAGNTYDFEVRTSYFTSETEYKWDNIGSLASKTFCNVTNKLVIVGPPVIAGIVCYTAVEAAGIGGGFFISGPGVLAIAVAANGPAMGAAAVCAGGAVAVMGKHLAKLQHDCDNYEASDFDWLDKKIKKIKVVPEALFMGKTYLGEAVEIYSSDDEIVNIGKLQNLNVDIEIDEEDAVLVKSTVVEKNKAFFQINFLSNCKDIQGGGICYSKTNAMPAISGDNCLISRQDDGFTSYKSIGISSLTPDTEYYVRAFAQAGTGEYMYSGISKIRTLPDIKLILTVVGVTQNSAKCNVTVEGGSELILKRGVCWSTSFNPTTDSHKVESSGSLVGISGLLPETKYYIRAYAITENNVVYSNQVMIETLPEELELEDTYFANTKWNVHESGQVETIINISGYTDRQIIPVNATDVVEFTKDALIANMPGEIEGVKLSQEVSVISKGEISIVLTASMGGISMSYTCKFKIASAQARTLTGELFGQNTQSVEGGNISTNINVVLSGTRIK